MLHSSSLPLVLVLTLENLFEGFLEVGDLNLVLLIFKPFGFGSNIFFQIQEPLGLVQKPSLVPCKHYTFPNFKDYMHVEFYNKLKHGLCR
jgi:hypothetical protein